MIYFIIQCRDSGLMHDASKIIESIINDTNSTVIAVAMPRVIFHPGRFIYFHDFELRATRQRHIQFDKFEFGIDCTRFNFRLLAYGSSNGSDPTEHLQLIFSC